MTAESGSPLTRNHGESSLKGIQARVCLPLPCITKYFIIISFYTSRLLHHARIVLLGGADTQLIREIKSPANMISVIRMPIIISRYVYMYI